MHRGGTDATLRGLRVLALVVATLGLLTGPTATIAGAGPADAAPEPVAPASHDSAEAPTAAQGFAAQPLASAEAPTAITFHAGPDAAEDLPSVDPPTKDLYYATLGGEVVHLDLAWSPVGPFAVDRTVVADGFNLPLGVAFDDEGDLYVSDSYDHEAAERPVGVVYEVDPTTGEREAVVDGIPNGQHNVNHLRFGPDERLYLPVGNPNDSGNGTGTGHTDIFPYTGAFLSVDVDRLDADGPAVLHWTDDNGEPIPDDQIVDHEVNQDFADKVDVLAQGFRNIFGITWAPDDLDFEGAYTGTNGADTPNSPDTLERIQDGAHHGYPFCVSQGDPGDTEDLAKQLWAGSPHEDFDCTRSPPAEAVLGYHVCATGLDFPRAAEPGHPDFTFPDHRRSSVYVGECAFFQNSWIDENLEHPSAHNTAHQVTEVVLDDDGDAADVRAFVKGLALPTDVQAGPDGALYVADAGAILRVAPTPASGTHAGPLLPLPLDQGPAVPVAAVGQSFVPQVTLVPTDTPVEWTGGVLPHTVTSSAELCTPTDEESCTNDDEEEGAFHGLVTGPGETFTHTFEEAGVQPYFCEFHYGLGMTGLVVAVDASDPYEGVPRDLTGALDEAPDGAGAHGHAGHSHAPRLAE